MAKIAIIRNTYGGTQYLQKALNYVSDKRALSAEAMVLIYMIRVQHTIR